MQTTEKLTTLREKLRDAGMDGYVVTTGDFHGSEYVGSFFKTRAWLSGFTGSAGTLVVLPERAALWTDGRYFLQAAQQLAGSSIDLMRDGQPGVPSVAGYLAEHLPRGGTLGFDGRTVSAAFARGLEKALAPREIRFAADRDLVDEIWADRPALSAEPVWELDAALAGLTREEKLALLRRDMAAQDADTLLLTALDEIAWTLNLRGGDVACTPVFLSASAPCSAFSVRFSRRRLSGRLPPAASSSPRMRTSTTASRTSRRGRPSSPTAPAPTTASSAASPTA